MPLLLGKRRRGRRLSLPKMSRSSVCPSSNYRSTSVHVARVKISFMDVNRIPEYGKMELNFKVSQFGMTLSLQNARMSLGMNGMKCQEIDLLRYLSRRRPFVVCLLMLRGIYLLCLRFPSKPRQVRLLMQDCADFLSRHGLVSIGYGSSCSISTDACKSQMHSLAAAAHTDCLQWDMGCVRKTFDGLMQPVSRSGCGFDEHGKNPRWIVPRNLQPLMSSKPECSYAWCTPGRTQEEGRSTSGTWGNSTFAWNLVKDDCVTSSDATCRCWVCVSTRNTINLHQGYVNLVVWEVDDFGKRRLRWLACLVVSVWVRYAKLQYHGAHTAQTNITHVRRHLQQLSVRLFLQICWCKSLPGILKKSKHEPSVWLFGGWSNAMYILCFFLCPVMPHNKTLQKMWLDLTCSNCR